jgi:hypothetical protein
LREAPLRSYVPAQPTQWFELLTIDPEIQIDLSDVHLAPDDDVLAAGYLLLGPTQAPRTDRLTRGGTIGS